MKVSRPGLRDSERTELQVRLLEAMIRIQVANLELTRARILKEESIGIFRSQEMACSARLQSKG